MMLAGAVLVVAFAAYWWLFRRGVEKEEKDEIQHDESDESAKDDDLCKHQNSSSDVAEVHPISHHSFSAGSTKIDDLA